MAAHQLYCYIVVMLTRRTPLKRSTKPIKRSPLKRSAPKKRKQKTPEQKLREELWELCKQIIRLKYGNTCYTCDKKDLEGSNWQTGHFIPSSVCGVLLRFDLRNLRPQCFRCNISLVGNGSEFYRRMVAECGQLYVDQLFIDKHKITKGDKNFYQMLIDLYAEELHILRLLQ